MKKYSFLILAFMLIFSLPACSQQAETAPSSLEELNQSSSAGEAAGQSLAVFHTKKMLQSTRTETPE